MHIQLLTLTALLASLTLAAPAPNQALDTREEEAKCFQIQARSCPNADVRGKYLTDHAYFISHSKLADTFTLDSASRLRVAEKSHKCSRDQAEALVVKTQSKHFDGKADFKKPKHIDWKDEDVAKCRIEGDVLKCETENGDKAYAKKDKYLYIGKWFDGKKFDEVEMAVQYVQCPSTCVWTTWGGF